MPKAQQLRVEYVGKTSCSKCGKVLRPILRSGRYCGDCFRRFGLTVGSFLLYKLLAPSDPYAELRRTAVVKTLGPSAPFATCEETYQPDLTTQLARGLRYVEHWRHSPDDEPQRRKRL